MREPRDIELDEPFDDVDGDLGHSELMAAAYPLTAALAVPFTTLRATVRQQKAAEATLKDNVLLARALAFSADDDLNRLVDDTKNAVLAVSNNNYQAPLYKQLFGGESPSEVRKPLLGSQLATMRLWVGPLGAAGHTELSAIAVRLTAAIAKADEAETKMALAHQALDQFNAGPRTVCINECNALRKLTYGKLGEIIHNHPELPNDFADRFFITSGGSRSLSITELELAVERSRGKLKRQEAQLAAMKEKAASQLKARQEAELAERKARFDDAQKRAKEAAEEVAKLQAEMEAGSSG